jgi:hypothetical protein
VVITWIAEWREGREAERQRDVRAEQRRGGSTAGPW